MLTLIGMGVQEVKLLRPFWKDPSRDSDWWSPRSPWSDYQKGEWNTFRYLIFKSKNLYYLLRKGDYLSEASTGSHPMTRYLLFCRRVFLIVVLEPYRVAFRKILSSINVTRVELQILGPLVWFILFYRHSYQQIILSSWFLQAWEVHPRRLR